MNKIKRIFAFLVCAIALLSFTACSTLNPNTGEREFDPVKTQSIKEATKPLVASLVRRGIVDIYEKDPNVLIYFQASAQTFCTMRDQKAFSVQVMRLSLERTLADTGIFPNSKVDPLIIDVKNLIIAIYAVQYENRLRADLSEEEFLWNILDSMCQGFETGISDAKLELGI